MPTVNGINCSGENCYNQVFLINGVARLIGLILIVRMLWSTSRQRIRNFTVEEYVLQVGAARRFEQAKQYDAAIDELKKVLAAKPDIAEVHYELGIIYKQRAMDDEAIDSFRHVLRLNPRDGDVYADLGEAQYHAHYYDDALGSFQRLIEIHPESPVSHYNLGMVYLMKDDYDPAIREFERALELKNDFDDARTALATAKKDKHQKS